MFKINANLSGYGRGCGYKSQCSSTPQKCTNYWGHDSNRKRMVEIKDEGCKIECCDKDFCHTPVDKRPRSPLRIGRNKTTVYNDDAEGPMVGARGKGVTSGLHTGLLSVGIVLNLFLFHINF